MNHALLAAGFFVSAGAQACATCGLAQSFTPLMLLISTGFVLLPLSFAGAIAWKVWKDSKRTNTKKIPPASA